MGEVKKLVVPGEYIAGAEEAMPGENAYSDKDEVYSASFGEVSEKNRVVDVAWEKTRHIPLVKPGTDLICMVMKMSATKAFLDCTMAEAAKETGSSMKVSAVLPVQNVKRGYVRDLKDEVRTGDILMARVSKIERDGIDVSICDDRYGVMKAYCVDCRRDMVLKSGALICSNCGRRGNRKLSSEYPSSE